MRTIGRAAFAVASFGLCLAASPSHAQQQSAPRDPLASFTVISPIFSQLVSLAMPSGFVPAFENVKDGFYIREAVPKGETVQAWTQMITVTGTKGLAANPKLTPEAYAVSLANGFKTACPENFTAMPLGPMRIGDQDAFAAVAGCGRIESSATKHGETALIVAVKGSADAYSIQWAQRAPSVAGKPAIDAAVWQARLKQLSPIRVCAIVPGERAPYPNCVNAK